MNARATNTAKIYICTIVFPVLISSAYAQNHCPLCDAVNKGKLNRVEKIVKNEILKYKYGKVATNGSSSYPTYHEAFDSIVSWLNKKECVATAAWDKCQSKIMIYPGHAVIGAVFKTPKGDMEKTFLLRLGKIMSINRWLGWLHHFKTKERFYYKEMKHGNGFVKQQKALCKEEEKRYDVDVVKPDTVHFSSQDTSFREELIPYQNLLGTFVSANSGAESDTATFTLKDEYHALSLTRTSEKRAEYWFRMVQPQMINSIGTYSPWRIQIAKVEILSSDSIIILYSNSYDFKNAQAVIYTKK